MAVAAISSVHLYERFCCCLFIRYSSKIDAAMKGTNNPGGKLSPPVLLGAPSPFASAKATIANPSAVVAYERQTET
jgi:hypothetical protein